MGTQELHHDAFARLLCLEGADESAWLQLLHLLKQLKEAGMFVVVALAQPFNFEGARRIDAAEALTQAVASAAHLAVIVQQVGSLRSPVYKGSSGHGVGCCI